MFKHFGQAIVVVSLLAGSPYAHGQKATEVFIPIGQSPGLSGKHTSLGKITAIDTVHQTFAMADAAGAYTVTVTAQTAFWLDRSKLKLPNQSGAFADLRKDVLVEVKYEYNQRRDKGTAEWIKIQVAN